ncbi:MAG: hypothetical protein GY774_31185 [Planctomycetes bacterium]|nr:hypothetical protein [Planctomycetota bacterium]
MTEKEKIRPIYSQLQVFLSRSPKVKYTDEYIHNSTLWEQYNSTIDKLNNFSGRHYEYFKVHPITAGGMKYMKLAKYRRKLLGLISELHVEFFSDEAAFKRDDSRKINQIHPVLRAETAGNVPTLFVHSILNVK